MAIIRRNPTNIAEYAADDVLVGQTVTDIARRNLATLDRQVIARAARNSVSPVEVAVKPAKHNLESDWRSRMDERRSILQDLYADGFISEDELMARDALAREWDLEQSDS